MNTQLSTIVAVERLHADHDATQRLGDWTVARAFEVRARRSSVVVDLRSPQIPDGDIEIELTADHSTIKLLVPEDAVIDQWGLTWTGRGRVKQTFHHAPAAAGRRIRLTGHVSHGEIRVQSGGIARLSAMASRQYLADARQAHAEGTVPTLDDPAGSA